MSKKGLSIVLIIVAVVTIFIGVVIVKNKKNPEDNNNSNVATEINEADNKENEKTKGEVNSSNKTEDAAKEEIVQYTLEDIAALNDMDVDDVFVNYSGDYINFIGCTYSDMIVKNEEDAYKSLGYVSELIGCEGLDLTFNRKDISPVTHFVYYTFIQTQDAEINGKKVSARFFNNVLKVITDADGNILGLSADLYRGGLNDLEPEDWISESEAVSYLRNVMSDSGQEDIKIYEDNIELVYWEDNTARDVGEGRVAPAWAIYMDNPEHDNDESNESAPYQLVVVSATPMLRENYDEESKPAIFSILDSYGVGPEYVYESYTSELYFNGLEDGGKYTYNIDLDWVKDSYPEYSGVASKKVTVDTMYDPENEIYILGSLSRKIVPMNEHDMENYNTTNALVSTNPEDKDSWHFQIKGDEEENIKYFCDPDYILGAYECMCIVYDEFVQKYGIKSIDGSGMPVMLFLYDYSDSYPSSIDGFECNAYNSGQNSDWEVMATSPMLAECLNPEVMGHEFTHGINSQLTETQYMNAQGAIIESYADIIGKLMAKVLDTNEHDTGWDLSGYYYETMRSLSDPYEHKQPQYVGGKYYIYPLDSTTSTLYNDEGGVHTNSGICNKVAYEFSCAENLPADEENLSFEENLDVWFETLYCATYMTNYNDLGCFLYFAGFYKDLSDKQINHMLNVMYKYGLFDSDNDDSLQDGVESDVRKINFKGSFDDESVKDYYSFSISIFDDNGDGEMYVVGGLSENLDRVYRLGTEDITGDKLEFLIDVGDRFYGEALGSAWAYNVPADTDQITFKFYEIVLNPSEVYYFDPKEVVYGPSDILYDGNESIEFMSKEAGNYLVTTQDTTGDYSDINVYYFYVN